MFIGVTSSQCRQQLEFRHEWARKKIAMTSWFEKGRPALFEALNTICQQIDRDLLTGMFPDTVP